jgi:beta-glucosidase-like glycosyl hydrolase/CubicO group peptidase (beta-lactamase class C family)
MDAEWGVAMRLFGEERFPYAQTIGAANDEDLTEKIGYHMGIEASQFGLHFNFAPVADVNNNPKNPVIGFRAYGATTERVVGQVTAMVKGIENAHVLSCLKHFPGHGDTEKDSHKELPTVSKSKTQFEQMEFKPFEAGIKAGASAVMVAHLNVPALDPSGTPSSLSKTVIQKYLREQLHFKGLVISDALNMQAVSDKYGKDEVVAMAYIAGCDILLYPESVQGAIQLIKKKIDAGDLEESIVNERCKQVLRAKYKAIINKPQIKRIDPAPERQLINRLTYEKAMVCLKNDRQALPINRVDQSIVRIAIGTNTISFRSRLDDYCQATHYKFYTPEDAVRRLRDKKWPANTIFILDYHSDSQRSRNNYDFGNWNSVAEILPEQAKKIGVFFGSPMVFENEKTLPESLDAVVVAYENNGHAQERAAQAILGAFTIQGKLPYSINEWCKIGSGIPIQGNGRLKYSQPEELGINPGKMREVDEIVQKAIDAKALPGCQLVVAIDGKIILQKAYGTTMYEKGDTVTNDHIYDIASITKIAASTGALMHLESTNQFNTNKTLQQLVPDLVENTSYAELKTIDLLTHQAGLTPWIPFYKRTIKNGELDSEIYSKTKTNEFIYPVAEGIWVKKDYWKELLKTIVETPLTGKKSYEYSDLSYYFFNKYIERTGGMRQNEYVDKVLYAPLGLKTMTYLPLEKFPLNRIVPTEYDKEFRKQLIHGYVHDPGAAMMGGVAGHAGLFSNALDLAKLMELYMNKGQLGDQAILKKEVVEKYTACQFCPTNRRGIGFDKPTVSIKNGPTCDLVSSATFGHSGFTGTIAWADPVHRVNFVFLSNRVYPDADNWKITKMSVRTEIQRVIYEALFEARQKK